MMRKSREKIGIVCCSNGMKGMSANQIQCLRNTLLSLEFIPVFSDCIYERESVFAGTAQERAQALMEYG